MNHYRQQNPPVFGNTEGADNIIDGLLPVLGYFCIHPVSLTDIISEWSHQMLSGEDKARLATAMTMGSRIDAAT